MAMPGNVPRDDSYTTGMLAASNDSLNLPVILWADPVTHRLLVNATTIESTGLVPKVYDYISLSYTGSNLTGVVYKTGGSGGTTVATLAIAYTGSNITSVTRT